MQLSDGIPSIYLPLRVSLIAPWMTKRESLRPAADELAPLIIFMESLLKFCTVNVFVLAQIVVF
jgi:hypothetical protein